VKGEDHARLLAPSQIGNAESSEPHGTVHRVGAGINFEGIPVFRSDALLKSGQEQWNTSSRGWGRGDRGVWLSIGPPPLLSRRAKAPVPSVTCRMRQSIERTMTWVLDEGVVGRVSCGWRLYIVPSFLSAPSVQTPSCDRGTKRKATVWTGGRARNATEMFNAM
jgi:hypothetical protein